MVVRSYSALALRKVSLNADGRSGRERDAVLGRWFGQTQQLEYVVLARIPNLDNQAR